MSLSHASLPCNLSIEKLVDSVGPKFIFDYLEKTLGFLTSNAKELPFPKLLPSKEEFLQRIAKDHSCLSLPVFNGECKKIIAAIKTVLELNKNVFRWSCSYKNLTSKESCLIYLKQYFLLPNVSRISDRLKVRLGPPPNSDASDLPTNTKITFLNTTLKFIKDADRLFLRYPEMTVSEVDYFRKLLESPNMDEDVGFGFKSLYTPLWEAMRIFSLKFEFQITVVETSKSYACLVLHKVPKCKKTISQNNNVSGNDQNIKAKNRKLEHKTQLLQRLSGAFIDNTIRTTLAFIENDSKAQIVFENLTNDESVFCQSLSTICKKEQMVNLFEEKHKILLRTIHRLLSTVYRDMNLMMRQKKGSSKSVFMVTCIKKLKKNKSCLTESGSSQSSSVVVSQSRRSRFKENINNNRTPSVNQWRDRSLSLKRGSRSKSAINFNSGGIINLNPIDKTNTTDNDRSIDNQKTTDNLKTRDKNNAESAIANSMYSKRHQKILEDMAVPLESDKATRMMRLMGWEGGALGARGEGITEPLLPAFQIKTGAGLGHIPPSPKTAKTKSKQAKVPQIALKSSPFRVDFLNHISKLVVDDCAKLIVKLDKNIVKKQQKFVNEIVDAFNGRSKVVLRDEVEVDLVLRITDCMDLSPDLRLSVELSSDRRQLTMKKEIVAHTKSKNKLETVHRRSSNGRSTNACLCNMILTKILQFLQSDLKSKQYRTAWVMNNADFKFFDEIVRKINNRTPVSVAEEDRAIFDKIMCYIGDIDVEVKFCSTFQKFTINKIFYERYPKYTEQINADDNNMKSNCDLTKNDKDDNCNEEEEVIYVHIENDVVEIYDSDNEETNGEVISKESTESLIQNDTKEPKEDDIIEDNVVSENTDQNLKQNLTTEPKENNIIKNTVVSKSTDQNSNNSSEMSGNCKETRITASDVFKKEFNVDIANCHTEKEGVVGDIKPNVNVIAKIENVTVDQHSALAEELLSLEASLTDVCKTIKNEDPITNEKAKDTVKRTRTLSSNESRFSKKSKGDFPKLMCIKHFNDKPILMAKDIQKRIHDNIQKTLMLQCHGLISDYLIYACFDLNSLAFIETVAKELNYDLEDFDTFQIHKVFTVEIKFRCFIDFNVFDALEKFNAGLKTEHWHELNRKVVNDFLYINIEMDGESLKFISDRSFSCHAGVDRVQFTLLGGRHKL